MGPWIDHFFSGGREIKRSVLLFLLFSRASSSNEHEEFRSTNPFFSQKEGIFRYFFNGGGRGGGKKSHQDVDTSVCVRVVSLAY